jgi:hypothetical protein
MPSNEDFERARREMAAGPPVSGAPSAAGDRLDTTQAGEEMNLLHEFAFAQKVEASAETIAKQVASAQTQRDAASRFTRGMN